MGLGLFSEDSVKRRMKSVINVSIIMVKPRELVTWILTTNEIWLYSRHSESKTRSMEIPFFQMKGFPVKCVLRVQPVREVASTVNLL